MELIQGNRRWLLQRLLGAGKRARCKVSAGSSRHYDERVMGLSSQHSTAGAFLVAPSIH